MLSHVLVEIREAQVPLLSALLLGGSAAKMTRALRVGSLDAGLGPTALFPVHLRRQVALGLVAAEFICGSGLVVTAGRLGQGEFANAVRLTTSLLFLVATCALIELRTSHPEVGCGCFGEFSTAPVSGRTLVRSSLLSVAALSTIGLPPLRAPQPGVDAARLLAIFAVEFVVIAALSPELGEALVRLGYSEPCELRRLPAVRTLAALRRSSQWRRRAALITTEVPLDMWRELCWRYVVFPARRGERDAEIVFAVYLRPHRPVIHAALVDAATGEALDWPAAPARRGVARWLLGGGPGKPGRRFGRRRSLPADRGEPGQGTSRRAASDLAASDQAAFDLAGSGHGDPAREGRADDLTGPGTPGAPAAPAPFPPPGAQTEHPEHPAAQTHPGRPRQASLAGDHDRAAARRRVPAGIGAVTDPGRGIPAVRVQPPARPKAAGPGRAAPRPPGPGPGPRPPGSAGLAGLPGTTGSPGTMETAGSPGTTGTAGSPGIAEPPEPP
jgi:hypothetical protein